MNQWGTIQGVFLKALPSPWTFSSPGSKHWRGYRKKNVLQSLLRAGLRAQAVSWPQGSQNIGSGVPLLSFPVLIFPSSEEIHVPKCQPSLWHSRGAQPGCSHSLIARESTTLERSTGSRILSWQPGQEGHGRSRTWGTQG